ncbi:hypothetical protein D0812_25210 [Vibrio owensii]|uniref:Secreted protein n=1 Tax=Vibrio owensii TaxID=696485 RepID=A0ABN5QFZ5_9VIBR|nr:hypothetical protein D0812_25210 [Vibrio owensii]
MFSLFYLIFPFTFDATALLPALVHPNHIADLCSWDSLVCRLAVAPTVLGNHKLICRNRASFW